MQQKMTPEEIMQGAKNATIKDCPSAMWNVTGKSNIEVVYEWQTMECPGMDKQYEIAKLMSGKEGIHRVAYTTKKLPVGEAVRATWLQLISAAKVKKSQ